MPFNYDSRQQYQGIDPRIIQGASKSPFQIAGETMTTLNDSIDNRAFERDIRGVKDLGGLSMLTPTTDKQRALMASKQGIFNALAQQESRALQNQLAQGQLDMLPVTQQKMQSDMLTSQLGQQEAQRVFNIRQGATRQLEQGGTYTPDKFSLQLGKDGSVVEQGVSPTGFNALSIPQRISAERQVDPKGQSATFDLMKEKNDLMSLANTSSKRDMLKQMEDAFIQSNPNPTVDETKQFYSTALTKMQAGASTVAQDINEAEASKNYAKAQEYKAKFARDPNSPSQFDMGDMKKTEVNQFDNLSPKEQASLSDTTKSMKANQVFVSGVNKVESDYNNDNLPTSGLYDSAKQKLEEYYGTGSEQMLKNVDFKSRSGRLLGAYMKATSGLAVSDSERAFLTDLFTGGFIDDEKTILARMNSFKKSMVDENNVLAGSIFNDAPYSATKYRQYEDYKEFEKKDNKTPNKSVTVVDYSTAFR